LASILLQNISFGELHNFFSFFPFVGSSNLDPVAVDESDPRPFILTSRSLQKKKKDGNKPKDGEKKQQPKNKQQQNGGQQQQKKQKDQADGNKNKNNKPRNENKPKQQQGDQKQRNQAQPQKKQHAGTGGHLAKIRAQAESKGPQQKSNKFKPAGEKIQSGKQQKLTKRFVALCDEILIWICAQSVFYRNSLDDLKITVEGKDKKQNAGRAGIFKEHKSSPKPAKQQRQKQDNGSVDDLRISVAVPEQQQQRKDVQTKSKEQTKEKAKQKVAAAKTEERAAQLHERRVIAAGAVAASTDNKPKTLSERWSAAVASIPVPAPGSRVVYIAK
jgi:hypothetical protein